MWPPGWDVPTPAGWEGAMGVAIATSTFAGLLTGEVCFKDLAPLPIDQPVADRSRRPSETASNASEALGRPPPGSTGGGQRAGKRNGVAPAGLVGIVTSPDLPMAQFLSSRDRFEICSNNGASTSPSSLSTGMATF